MDTWKMNWSDERVVSAMDDYRTRKIQTLEELQATIESINGTTVSKKTLGLRVRGNYADQNPEQSSSGKSAQKEENADSGDDDIRPVSTEQSDNEKRKSESDDNSDPDEATSSMSTTIKKRAVSGAAVAAVDDGLVLSDLLSKKVVLANGETAYRINSQRCKAQLGYRGFMYTPVSQMRDSQAIRWRCLNSRNNCSAWVTTDKDFTKVTAGPNGHGDYCSPDEIGLRLKAATNDIKISAEFWTGSMRDLYNEFTESLARTDPRVLSVFPTVDIHALLKSMNNHRVSQICRKQFLLDKQENERRERNAATTRKRKLDEFDKKRLFPETICCECGEVVGNQNSLIAHLQTVHERTDLKVEFYEFENRDLFTAWLQIVYNQTTNKLNQLGTFDLAAYYLCSKDDRVKRPTSIGIHCSAFVKARMGSLNGADKVKVDYCLQHTFHDNDLGPTDDAARLAALAPAEVIKHMGEQNERKRQFVEELMKSGRCQRIQRVAGGSQLFPGQIGYKATDTKSTNDATPSTSSDRAVDFIKTWNVLEFKSRQKKHVPLVASARQPNFARVLLPNDPKADLLEPQEPKMDDVFLSGLITQIDMECDLIQTRSLRLTTTEAAENCLRYLAQARAALIEDPGCRHYLPRAGRSLSPAKTALSIAKSSPSAAGIAKPSSSTTGKPSPSTASRTVPVGWTAVRPQVGLRVPVPWPKSKGAALTSAAPTTTRATAVKPSAVGSEGAGAPKSNDNKAAAGNKATEAPPKLNPTKSSINGSSSTSRISVNAGLVASALRGNLKLVKGPPPERQIRAISTPTQENQCCECDVKHSSPLLVMMRCRQCRLVYHKQCAHTCKI